MAHTPTREQLSAMTSPAAKQKRSATTKENTNLKYLSFLLNLYKSSKSKPFLIPKISAYHREQNVNNMALNACLHFGIITMLMAKRGDKQNAHTGKIVRWRGERPTEEMARKIINWMSEEFTRSVKDKEKRTGEPAKRDRKKIEPFIEPPVQLPIAYEQQNKPADVPEPPNRLNAIDVLKLQNMEIHAQLKLMTAQHESLVIMVKHLYEQFK